MFFFCAWNTHHMTIVGILDCAAMTMCPPRNWHSDLFHDTVAMQSACIYLESARISRGIISSYMTAETSIFNFGKSIEEIEVFLLSVLAGSLYNLRALGPIYLPLELIRPASELYYVFPTPLCGLQSFYSPSPRYLLRPRPPHRSPRS